MPDTRRRTGARLLFDALAAHGIARVFAAGGSGTDAPADGPALVAGRQADAVALMAEAHGRLTGQPGVALPGVGCDPAALAAAVEAARRGPTPLLLIVEGAPPDGVPTIVADAPDGVAAAVTEALAAAAGGPAVLRLPPGLPDGPAGDAPIPPVAPPPPEEPEALAPEAAGPLLARLAAAERPLLVAGGGGWNDERCAALRTLAESLAVPVACGAGRADLMDNESPCFVGEFGRHGTPTLPGRLDAADLVLAVGTGLAPDALAPAALTGLAAAVSGTEGVERRAWTDAARNAWLDWLQPVPDPAAAAAGLPDAGMLFDWLRDRLPPDSVVTLDSGAAANAARRHLLQRRPGRLLCPDEPVTGYAVPAALAAKLACPRRVVIGFTGAAGLIATGHELATAVEAGAALILLAADDAGCGLAPGAVAAYAESVGAFGVAVSTAKGFVPAFWEAMWSRRPAVIEVRVAPPATAA